MRSNEKVFGLIFDQICEQLLGFASLESVLKLCGEEVCDICEKHTWYEWKLERPTVFEVV